MTARRFNRRTLTAGAGAAAATAIAACGPERPAAGGGEGSAQSPVSSGKPITLLDTFAPAVLDPAGGGRPNVVKPGMGELLVRVNRKGELEPWLASSWRNLDPLRWEIKLREGVSFWDGTPMDAAAVKASLERVTAMQGEARLKLAAAGIDVVDARTLVVRTQAPNASLPNALTTWAFAIHSAKAAAAMGDDAFARQPVLTGPFKPVDYKKDELLTLVRNDAYWAGKPFLPGLQIRYVNDPNTRVLALQSGDADLVFAVPTQALPTLRNTPGIRVPETPADSFVYMLTNMRTPPTDDARVRRAISLGIDRRALVQQVLEGAHDVATDIYAPIYSWSLKNAYPSDAARAARVLDEAGWLPGPDGVRRKDGRPLTFTLLHYPQGADLLPLAIAIQAQLKKIGMNAELKEVPIINNATKTPDWGAAMFNNGSGAGDPMLLLDTFFRPEGGQHFGFTHPKTPGLIEKIQTTFDQPKRLEAVREFQDLMIEEAPLLPLVVVKARVAAGERLKNVQPHPIGTMMMVEHTWGK